MTDTSQKPEPISVFTGPSPKVNRIGLDQPWSWLAKGWQDLRRSPGVGLTYGVLFAVAGVVLLTAIWFLDIFVHWQLGYLIRLELRLSALLLLAIVLADEFQNGLCPGIANTVIGQTQDPRVSTGTIGESGCDLLEQQLDRFLVAE